MLGKRKGFREDLLDRIYDCWGLNEVTEKVLEEDLGITTTDHLKQTKKKDIQARLQQVVQRKAVLKMLDDLHKPIKVIEEAKSEQNIDKILIVMALSAHRRNAEIQREGCSALWNLAFASDDNKVKIARLGGIEAILDALSGHKDDAEVQKQGCWALCNIGWSSPELQRKIKAAGGEEAVKRAMNAPNATQETKLQGKTLLDKLGHAEKRERARERQREADLPHGLQIVNICTVS